MNKKIKVIVKILVNTKILYFASNRGGGQGGMDIW